MILISIIGYLLLIYMLDGFSVGGPNGDVPPPPIDFHIDSIHDVRPPNAPPAPPPAPAPPPGPPGPPASNDNDLFRPLDTEQVSITLPTTDDQGNPNQQIFTFDPNPAEQTREQIRRELDHTIEAADDAAVGPWRDLYTLLYNYFGNLGIIPDFDRIPNDMHDWLPSNLEFQVQDALIHIYYQHIPNLAELSDDGTEFGPFSDESDYDEADFCSGGLGAETDSEEEEEDTPSPSRPEDINPLLYTNRENIQILHRYFVDMMGDMPYIGNLDTFTTQIQTFIANNMGRILGETNMGQINHHDFRRTIIRLFMGITLRTLPRSRGACAWCGQD